MADRVTGGYRLAVLCDSNVIGGAERFLAHLIRSLPADVEVVAVGHHRHVLQSVTDERAGATAALLPVGYAAAVRAFRRLRPDVVHANLTALTSCRSLVLAALTLRIPVVLVDHLPTPGLTWRGRTLQRLLTQLSAERIAVGARSARLVERYAGLRPGSVSSIPNGVPRRGHPVPGPAGPRCAFGFLGRLEHQKGIDLLLEAFASVPDATLEIMGEGNELGALRAAADSAALAGRVRFTPASPHTDAFWQRIDVLVLPSRSEGMPLVVLEAVQQGRPVVASEVGSIREVLDEGCAVLVPPNDVGALAAALRDVSVDRERREQLAARALERAATAWSAAEMAREYDDRYRAALRRP